MLLGNEWDTNFRSEIEHTLGEIQIALIRSAEGVFRRKMFRNGKNQFKNSHHKRTIFKGTVFYNKGTVFYTRTQV